MISLFNSIASLSDNILVGFGVGSLFDVVFSSVSKVPGLTVEDDVTSGVCLAEVAAVDAVLETGQQQQQQQLYWQYYLQIVFPNQIIINNEDY